ncbi:MAG: carbohydrate ABC transporter permease [Spirochaetales bacterium]|nr:carbohydrate ABC transporter permease [Spirochaetales bacterium]
MSRTPTLFPHTFVLAHYRQLFGRGEYLAQLANSVLYTTLTTLITGIIVLSAALGSYRGRIPWLRNLKFVAIMAFVFPTTLLTVPQYQILSHVGLVGTMWSVILVNVSLTAPFSFWLVEGFFDAVPRELEESGLIDGAHRWHIAIYILLPLAAPGIATIAVFTFVTSWTEYTFSAVLILDNALKTLPLGLADILASYNIDWGMLTSYTTLAMIPGIIFFILAGRFFIGGLVEGALKA